MRFLKIKETGSYTEFSKNCHRKFFWPLFLHKCLRLILPNLLLKIIGVLCNPQFLIFYLLLCISWFFKGSLTRDFLLQVFSSVFLSAPYGPFWMFFECFIATVCWHWWKIIVGVIVTGDKLTTSVTNLMKIRNKALSSFSTKLMIICPPVSLTLAINTKLKISPRVFLKILKWTQ